MAEPAVLQFHFCFVILQIPRLGERSETTVIGLFHIIWKTATGKLLAFKVTLQAFTADALAAAAGIAA